MGFIGVLLFNLVRFARNSGRNSAFWAEVRQSYFSTTRFSDILDKLKRPAHAFLPEARAAALLIIRAISLTVKAPGS